MPHAEWTENRPPRGFLRGFDVVEAWRRRELAWMLAQRQLKLRYKQTAFGVAWAVIQPLGAMLILTLVFSRAGIHTGDDDLPYAIFVLAGFVAWSYVSAAVMLAANSLVEDRALLTKVYFPRVLAPLASLLPPLVDLLVALALLAVAMAITGVAPVSAIALLPAALLLLAVTAAGIGLWLSALNVEYRDVRYALTFLTQAWFLASPVFYETAIVGEGWKRAVLHLNPLAGGIDLFRWTTVGGPAPHPEIGISIGVALAFLVGGVAYFARSQARLVDVA